MVWVQPKGWLSSEVMACCKGSKWHLATTCWGHNLCLFEVCNLSFKMFYHTQSQALLSQCCGASERFLWALPAVPPPALLAAFHRAPFALPLQFHVLLPTSPSAVPEQRSPARCQQQLGSESGDSEWHQSELQTCVESKPQNSFPAMFSLQDCIHLAPGRSGRKQETAPWTLEGEISFTSFVKFNLLVWVKLQHSENKGVMVRLKHGL